MTTNPESIEKTLLEVEKAKIDLSVSRMDLLLKETELRKNEHELNLQYLQEGYEMMHLKVARLGGPVNEDTVEKARVELYTLSRLFPGQPLTLDINSPGGSVSDGMELYGIVKELSKAGHQMITRISGEACSMGGVIAQAGDHRQIREGSYLHIHEASWGAIGKASEMRESADHVEAISRDIAKIYAKKSTMTADEIYERMLRREWWMGAEEALKLGFVDEVV